MKAGLIASSVTFFPLYLSIFDFGCILIHYVLLQTNFYNHFRATQEKNDKNN